MTTHGKRHAKQDIMDAAWKLFTEQGYDETTISQIIELSGKSRSTFYHHFRGKDELLFSLAYSYDSDYDSWLQTCDRTLPAADLLLAFNHFVLNNSDNRNNYIYQLVTLAKSMGVTWNDHFPMTAEAPTSSAITLPLLLPGTGSLIQ